MWKEFLVKYLKMPKIVFIEKNIKIIMIIRMNYFFLI